MDLDNLNLENLSGDALDAVIAKMAAYYEAKEESKPKPFADLQPKPKREKRKLRESKTESKRAPARLFIPVPDVGYHDAASFMRALVTAGDRVSKEGAHYNDPIARRDDEIKAIAGFQGYDPDDHHGFQEWRARNAARRDLEKQRAGNPPESAPPSGVHRQTKERRSYTPGMPDFHRKRVLDLLGRERMAASAIAEHEKLAGEAMAEVERDYQLGLALVERSRLVEIRKQLQSIGALEV